MNIKPNKKIKKGRFRVIVVTALIAFFCIAMTSTVWLIFYRMKVRAMSHDQYLFRQEISDLEWECAKLLKQGDYGSEAASLRDELARFREMMEVLDSRVKGKLLKIYEYDVFHDRPGFGFYVATDKDASLRYKVQLIADILSSVYFRNNPINVLRIENRDGKEIAVVDLRESGIEGVYTWRGGFFQGSSGGQWTTYMLVNAFLQRDYNGEWIDGVVFYYEGKPISNEWDHIHLHGVIPRKQA
jgi:hypothetical protein